MKYEPESHWILDYCRDNVISGDHNIYVDLGCAHPSNCSLTSFVRDLGWNGLAVDANPDYSHDWSQAGFIHHFVPALLSNQPRARFAVHENSFTSRISDSLKTDRPEQWGIKYTVEQDTTDLNWLLEQRGIGKIDLLTIDLEGHEFAVLSTLNFAKHRPAFIISEYVTQGEGTDPRVCQMLLKLGYKLIHMTESNLIFSE